MSIELPYFKFYPSEWIGGEITLEKMQTQGLFINICTHYWFKNCSMSLDYLNKRLINGKATLKQCLESLKNNNLIKVIDNKEISISFLDKQFLELEEKHIKRVEAGRKGGIASGKQRSSKGEAMPKHLEEDKEVYKEEDIYRRFDHLILTKEQFKKLNEHFTKQEIDGKLDDLENSTKNKNYKSAYLTLNNWLKREYPDRIPKVVKL